MIRYVPHTVRYGSDRPECDPSYTLEDHIASLRDVDPEKWARLQAEWEER